MSGRVSQARGDDGEAAVEAYLEACKLAGLGDVKRRQGGLGRMVRGEFRRVKQGSDFAGTLKGGRSIHLEVKSLTDAERLPHSALRKSQRDELARMAAVGGASVVVVLWGPLASRVSVVPWREIAPKVLTEKRGSTELERWRLPARTLLLEAEGVTKW